MATTGRADMSAATPAAAAAQPLPQQHDDCARRGCACAFMSTVSGM